VNCIRLIMPGRVFWKVSCSRSRSTASSSNSCHTRPSVVPFISPSSSNLISTSSIVSHDFNALINCPILQCPTAASQYPTTSDRRTLLQTTCERALYADYPEVDSLLRLGAVSKSYATVTCSARCPSERGSIRASSTLSSSLFDCII
jgi:hypothetical protein